MLPVRRVWTRSPRYVPSSVGSMMTSRCSVALPRRQPIAAPVRPSSDACSSVTTTSGRLANASYLVARRPGHKTGSEQSTDRVEDVDFVGRARATGCGLDAPDQGVGIAGQNRDVRGAEHPDGLPPSSPTVKSPPSPRSRTRPDPSAAAAAPARTTALPPPRSRWRPARRRPRAPPREQGGAGASSRPDTGREAGRHRVSPPARGRPRRRLEPRPCALERRVDDLGWQVLVAAHQPQGGEVVAIPDALETLRAGVSSAKLVVTLDN